MRTRRPDLRRLLPALATVLLLGGVPAAAAADAPDPPRKLVVIDAGHGGVDPGARGPEGTREKAVTLAVARRVAEILADDADLDVRLTRDRDTLISLRDRTRRANHWRGEAGKAGARDALFISIHCNASDQRSARGFETFFLSEAKTADARRVAQMENAAQDYEEAPRPGSGDPLSFILNDLRQNRYVLESSGWAARIQQRLDIMHPGPNRGVKQAGFVVLNGAFMPAVLVEIGFITNPAEEQMLIDPAEQRRIARELATSVREFFERSAAERLANSS